MISISFTLFIYYINSIKFTFCPIFYIIVATINRSDNQFEQTYNYQWNSVNNAIIFLYGTFLSTIDIVFVVFNTSSSPANTSLWNRRFFHERFQYTPLLQGSSQSQSHILGFHRKRFYKNSKSSNSLHTQLKNYTYIHIVLFFFCFFLFYRQ